MRVGNSIIFITVLINSTSLDINIGFGTNFGYSVIFIADNGREQWTRLLDKPGRFLAISTGSGCIQLPSGSGSNGSGTPGGGCRFQRMRRIWKSSTLLISVPVSVPVPVLVPVPTHISGVGLVFVIFLANIIGSGLEIHGIMFLIS